MNFFNYRANLIVPNISWGLGLHECDLLVLTSSGYATEIEIKVSKADLKVVVDAKGRCKIVKEAIVSKQVHKFKEVDIHKMAVLGAMRIHGLKKNIVKRNGIIDKLKEAANESRTKI